MKILLLLFAALLVAGCGEKSSSEGSESASENPSAPNQTEEPSADTAKPPPAEPASEESSETPNSLSDADVERLLKEAVEGDSLEGRDTIHGNLIYQTNESEPFSGWVKLMYDSGQVKGLSKFKDGKPADGLHTQWYENGQKSGEGTYKDGKMEGLWTEWHENGLKRTEATYKDDELITEKYWNSKGEEVETREEAEAAEPPNEESSETPKSLSDADVVRLLKEAVDESSLQFRNNISYQINKSKPYSGWAKKMHASGQVGSLSQFKDGKLRGLAMEWHENGRKWSEATYKDGEEVSAKYWNSDGKEIRFSEYLNHLLGVK